MSNISSKTTEKLWHIFEADTANVEFNNGIGQHPFGLPGVNCPKCGPNSGFRRLPFECPPEIRDEVMAVYKRNACLPVDEFQRHTDRWQAILRDRGFNKSLNPGDDFQPFIWETLTPPHLDYYWLLHTFIVSQRIADIIKDNQVAGVTLHPVVLARVGLLRSIESEEIPWEYWSKCNEPEDMYDVVPHADDPSVFGQFYTLVIAHDTRESTLIDELGDRIKKCPICGYIKMSQQIEIEINKQRSYFRKRNILPKRYTFPVDIFRSHIYYSGFIVRERVYELLKDVGFRNCRTRQISVVSDEEVFG
ncbi:MAG: hypothetical protein JW829_07275 [Pirellulales bacterium]|nr:hypothetical protein [Pirellulales bacterium]